MLIGLFSNADPLDIWLPALRDAMPDHDIIVGDAVMDRAAELDVLMAWAPPAELLKKCRRLKAILSLGAGVDHLLRHGEALPDVPIGRLVDPAMSERMSHFVIHAIIHHHRHIQTYQVQQRRAEWIERRQPDAGDLTVGFLGLGALGSYCAERVRMLGFNVCGWRRQLSGDEVIPCFAGQEGQDEMLSRAHFLVCLLPLTEQTQRILNRALFNKLPRGAVLINPGRGGHLVDADVVAALDDGQLSRASLDVFGQEPLPAGHPYWNHPDIVLTPHIAAQTVPATAARVMAGDIERIARGDRPAHCVEKARGY